MKKILIVLLLALGPFACTEQQRAKKYGGSATINLPPGKKLVVATWKEANLWLLVRERRENEEPERFEFRESSSWGVLEGRIEIVEK